MPAKINPLVCVGVPTWGRVTVKWARAYRHLGLPLGSTMAELYVENKPIGEARNDLMRSAIAAGADFLFFLGDDVLPPNDAITRLIHRAWAHPEIDLFTGVYWTKQWPTSPYLWRGMQRGPYWDWKMGEFFRVEQAGVDCLLVRLSDRVKALGPEWFSTEWLWTEDQDRPDALATEDFFFYTRARKAGIELWCDSNVQCLHEDRTSGLMFGLTQDMPQVTGMLETLPDPATPASPDKVVVADIGCGEATPWFGPAETTRVVRFDGNEKLNPDFRCDLRDLPVPDGSFDLVHSRHVLEHFGRAEAPKALAEWVRILRVGGEIRISVPNLMAAMRRVIELEEAPDGTGKSPYHWWQIYGEQRDEYDVHKNGFTPRRLKKLLELQAGLASVEVKVTGEGEINLEATATKVASTRPMALAPAWDEMVREGKADMPGLVPSEDEPTHVHVDTKAQAERLIDQALPVAEGAPV